MVIYHHFFRSGTQLENRVELFRKLSTGTVDLSLVQKGRASAKGIEPDNALATAYFWGILEPDGRRFTLLLRSTRYGDLDERTLEAIPFAVQQFAARYEFGPLAAVMRWPWDGGPAEIAGYTFLWCAVHKPDSFQKYFWKQPSKFQDAVEVMIGVATSKTEVREEMKVGKRKHQKLWLRFWNGVLRDAE